MIPRTLPVMFWMLLLASRVWGGAADDLVRRLNHAIWGMEWHTLVGELDYEFRYVSHASEGVLPLEHYGPAPAWVETVSVSMDTVYVPRESTHGQDTLATGGTPEGSDADSLLEAVVVVHAVTRLVEMPRDALDLSALPPDLRTLDVSEAKAALRPWAETSSDTVLAVVAVPPPKRDVGVMLTLAETELTTMERRFLLFKLRQLQWGVLWRGAVVWLRYSGPMLEDVDGETVNGTLVWDFRPDPIAGMSGSSSVTFSRSEGTWRFSHIEGLIDDLLMKAYEGPTVPPPTAVHEASWGLVKSGATSYPYRDGRER